MTAISDATFPITPNYETRWDEVLILSSRTMVAPPSWRPAVNAYRCSDCFVIYVDLAGVPPDSIEVNAHPGRVVVRGRRPAPEPSCLRSELAQLLALEIDQGAFERVLDLPQGIDPQGITTEYNDGMLKIRLPLVA
jgi:HSP20 family protein